MAKTRVLITVTTYPLPSRSYDELVCTAGILENGSWIRIYPVPFQFLEYRKWEWIELDLISHGPTHDFRLESHRPKHPELSDLIVIKRLGTDQDWYERKQTCLKHVYTNLTALIDDSKEPKNISLAAFKPTQLIKFIVEDDEREWKPQWLEQLKQMDFITSGRHASDGARIPIDKIPHKFKYQFEDDENRISTMTIEDWEIGALYRNCLAAAEGNESIAVEKVKEKYEQDFMQNKDITLFLGTTLEHHRARHTNPFTINWCILPTSESATSTLLTKANEER